MVDVGAVLKQLTRCSRVAQAHCCKQRRLAVVIRQFQVGAVLNQQVNCVTIVKLNSAAQARFSCWSMIRTGLQTVVIGLMIVSYKKVRIALKIQSDEIKRHDMPTHTISQSRQPCRHLVSHIIYMYMYD